MRKKDPAILAILLAVSMMTACANGGAAGAGTAAQAQTAAAQAGAGEAGAAEAGAAEAGAGKTGAADAASAEKAADTKAADGTDTAGAKAAAGDAGSGAGASSASENAAEVVSYDKDDLDTAWEDANPTTVTLSGAEAEVSGRGASFEDGKLLISEAGTYVLSGTFDGQVLVETGKEDVVRIVLNGVQITSEGSYAIASVKGQKLVVTLADGTENVLCVKGTADEDSAETEEEEADAAIYVKNDLTVNGGGVLNITSAGKGVHAKDVLRLMSGDYMITSADDAFNGKDGVAVEDGSFAVTITDTEEGKGITSKGDVVLNGGTMNISACSEGIEGLTVTVNGGSWYVKSSDDGMNAREKTESTETAEDTAAASAGTAVAEAGAEKAAAPETAMEGAPQGGRMKGGMREGGMGEMPEGGMPEGEMPEGGGSGRPENGGFGGRGGFGGMGREDMESERLKMEYNEKCVITVNGGFVQIDAGGDGIDSNGDIVLNGGEVYVSSSDMGMESALDMNGDTFVNGGTLVAAGMQGMAEPLSDESGQAVVTVYYDTAQAAGTELSLTGADGSGLASWTVPKQYSMVQVSASGLTTGESCTVTSGSDGKTIEVTAVNTYEGTASRGFGRGFGHGDSPRGQTQTQ